MVYLVFVNGERETYIREEENGTSSPHATSPEVEVRA